MKRFLVKSLLAICWWVQDIVKLCLVAFFTILLATSGWFYGYHDGREMRCFSVRLPGFEEYTDWEHGEVQIVRRFSMRANYRLGPWIEPEWTDTPDLAPETDELQE